MQISLIEASPVLRGAQAESLEPFALEPHWFDTLGVVKPPQRGEGMIVIANEFLDALPIRQFERQDGAWFERFVGYVQGSGFTMEMAPSPAEDDDLPVITHALQDEGAVVEICPAFPGLLADMAKLGEKAPVASLIIDYGPARSAAGDSLQAVRGHSYAPVFEAPGQADLTAHVDFETVARLATEAGLKAYGPVSQAHFLLALGLQQRSRQLMKGKPLEEAQDIALASARLVDPGQMGALFKALVLTRGIEQVPPPFDAVPAGETGTG